MRVLHFRDPAGTRRLGVEEPDGRIRAASADGRRLEDVLADPGGLGSLARGDETFEASTVRLLPPVVRPGKVMCIGFNYPDHADESHAERPAEPLFFSKFASAITGPNDDVVIPAAAPRRVDYEAELAVVIGRRGRDIPAADAMEHVAGYCAANDVTARDWQFRKPGAQWLLGKTFDTFLPLGPALVTPDEIDDLAAVRVHCLVDGEVLQDDVVGNMLFPIPELIAYVSRVVTLEPGDLLVTGTPAGVGMSRTPRRWLEPGNILETVVEGVGALRNRVVAAEPSG